jgi:hypothetical protein
MALDQPVFSEKEGNPMATTTNRTTTQVRDANIVAGIGKRLQNVQTVNLGGTAYTPSTLTQLFQSGVSSTANIAALRAQLKDALQAELLLTKQLNALAKALKAYVINEFGSTSSALGDFGFVPPKAPGTKDPVTKVVAAAKMRNTRVARNTKGKRQAEEIVGAVPQSISIAVNSSGKPEVPVSNGSGAGAGNSAAPAPPAVVPASSTSSK